MDYDNNHVNVPRLQVQFSFEFTSSIEAHRRCSTTFLSAKLLQVGDFGRSVNPGQLGLPFFMPPMDFTRM